MPQPFYNCKKPFINLSIAANEAPQPSDTSVESAKFARREEPVTEMRSREVLAAVKPLPPSIIGLPASRSA
jgi:hypothetical protein